MSWRHLIQLLNWLKLSFSNSIPPYAWTRPLTSPCPAQAGCSSQSPPFMFLHHYSCEHWSLTREENPQVVLFPGPYPESSTRPDTLNCCSAAYLWRLTFIYILQEPAYLHITAEVRRWHAAVSCCFSVWLACSLSVSWAVRLIFVSWSSVASLMIGGIIWDVQRWMRVFA